MALSPFLNLRKCRPALSQTGGLPQLPLDPVHKLEIRWVGRRGENDLLFQHQGLEFFVPVALPVKSGLKLKRVRPDSLKLGFRLSILVGFFSQTRQERAKIGVWRRGLGFHEGKILPGLEICLCCFRTFQIRPFRR